MERDEAIETLSWHEAELKALGEAQPDSDVDLFFDHERGNLRERIDAAARLVF